MVNQSRAPYIATVDQPESISLPKRRLCGLLFGQHQIDRILQPDDVVPTLALECTKDTQPIDRNVNIEKQYDPNEPRYTGSRIRLTPSNENSTLSTPEHVFPSAPRFDDSNAVGFLRHQ